MVQIEIRVKGWLDQAWSDWFEGLAIIHTNCGPDGADNETLLIGPVADQAALYGLLAKLGDLGLPLLSVKQVEDTE
jgi:hypothetical protein